jgi:hypothetical protein
MAHVKADMVQETSTSTGTGAVTLAGAVVRRRAFSSVMANADTCHYTIEHTTANEWEVGVGTYTAAGTTLTRTTVLSSSNAGAAVNFSAGTKSIHMGAPASASIIEDNLGDADVSRRLAVGGQLTVTAPDGGISLFRGTTTSGKGLRLYDTAGSYAVQAVDWTGVASYQPLTVAGSTISLGTTVAPTTTLALDISGLALNATPATTAASSKLWLGGTISFTLQNQSILGNLYYASGWKYIGNGSGGGISFAGSSTQSMAFFSAPNNTGGAGVAAAVTVPMWIDPVGGAVTISSSLDAAAATFSGLVTGTAFKVSPNVVDATPGTASSFILYQGSPTANALGTSSNSFDLRSVSAFNFYGGSTPTKLATINSAGGLVMTAGADFGSSIDVAGNIYLSATLRHVSGAFIVDRIISTGSTYLLETGNTGTSKITTRYSDFDTHYFRTLVGGNIVTLTSALMTTPTLTSSGAVSGTGSAGAVRATYASANQQTSFQTYLAAQPLDEKTWELLASSGGDFLLRTVGDAYASSTAVFTATRGTGIAVSNITFHVPMILSSSITATTGTFSGSVTSSGSFVTDGGIIQINRAADAVGTSAAMYIDSASPQNVTGAYSLLYFRTGGSQRWYMGKLNGAETGSNVGSDFVINAIDDTGSVNIGWAFHIKRNTRDVTFAGNSVSLDRIGAAAPAALYLNSDPAQQAYIMFRSAASTAGTRWFVGKQTDESFLIYAYNDTGGGIGTALQIARLTRVATFGAAVISGGNVTIPAASVLDFDTRATLSSPANSMLHILNDAATVGIRLDVVTANSLLIQNQAGGTAALTIGGGTFTSGPANINGLLTLTNTTFRHVQGTDMVDRIVNASSHFLHETGAAGTTDVTTRYSDFDTHYFRNLAGATNATLTSASLTVTGTVVAPGIKRLYNEVVLASALTTMSVTVPTGMNAKQIELDWNLSTNDGTDRAITLQIMVGASPIATATYYLQGLTGTGATASANLASATTSWSLGTGVFERGNLRFSSLTLMGEATYHAVSTTSRFAGVLSIDSSYTPVSGVTGFRITCAAAMKIGSYLRCYVVT